MWSAQPITATSVSQWGTHKQTIDNSWRNKCGNLKKEKSCSNMLKVFAIKNGQVLRWEKSTKKSSADVIVLVTVLTLCTFLALNINISFTTADRFIHGNFRVKCPPFASHVILYLSWKSERCSLSHAHHHHKPPNPYSADCNSSLIPGCVISLMFLSLSVVV